MDLVEGTLFKMIIARREGKRLFISVEITLTIRYTSISHLGQVKRNFFFPLIERIKQVRRSREQLHTTEDWHDHVVNQRTFYPEASLFPKPLRRGCMLAQGPGERRKSYPSLVNKHFLIIDQQVQFSLIIHEAEIRNLKNL